MAAVRDIVRAQVREAGALLLLLARAACRRPPRGSVWPELGDLLLRTIPLNVAAMAFVGAVVAIDGGQQVQRLFGDPGGLGAAALQLIVREFGPTFGGVIAATRLGSGIAAEIAAMSVSEQIDALRLCSADPVAELVSPRLRASFWALLGLGAVSTVTAAYTGDFTAQIAFGTRPGAFLDTSLLVPGDFLVAAAKCAAYGIAIPTMAARAGLLATGGSQAVGHATTRGVVDGIVAVIVLDLLLGGGALFAGV